MDLDELIFGRISGYLRRRKKQRLLKETSIVHLNEIRPRLLLMARAFTGISVEIYPAEREGGYKDHNFFLPASVSLFKSKEENLLLYYFRVVYLSVQMDLGLNFNDKNAVTNESAVEQGVNTSVTVLNKISQLYPLVSELHDKLLDNLKTLYPETDTTWLYGKWMHNRSVEPAAQKLSSVSDHVRMAMGVEKVSVVKAKPVEEITTVEVDRKQQEDYVLTHNFEKVETAEEFDGLWRDTDGDDEMEDHQNAIDELNMKFTVRIDDPVHSVYEAEFVENVSVSESSEKADENRHFLTYPEWDYARRIYRPDFCKVYSVKPSGMNPDYYHQTIRNHQSVLYGLRKMLTNLNNKLAQQRRQQDGPEYDLDALTDHFTDIAIRQTPSDNIYLSKRKKSKSLSILLLLDSSLSSDGYSDGNRVIDVEKRVTILFGEILNEFNVGFSVAAFHSKTRNFLSYHILKDFNESWDSSKYRIGSEEPAGYTRIGAALRHAGNEMRKQDAANKWILLLTDGKPNDYDRYEGRHGIQDVKQALRELREHRINSFAMAIEAQARYYLPQMFGQNHYKILSSPNEMLQSMVTLFEKIRYSS